MRFTAIDGSPIYFNRSLVCRVKHIPDTWRLILDENGAAIIDPEADRYKGEIVSNAIEVFDMSGGATIVREPFEQVAAWLEGDEPSGKHPLVEAIESIGGYIE